MRISSRGQVTIPKAVREQAGLLPGTEVECVVADDGVRLVKVGTAGRSTRGMRAVSLLRQSGERMAKSTDEIMALTRQHR